MVCTQTIAVMLRCGYLGCQRFTKLVWRPAYFASVQSFAARQQAERDREPGCTTGSRDEAGPRPDETGIGPMIVQRGVALPLEDGAHPAEERRPRPGGRRVPAGRARPGPGDHVARAVREGASVLLGVVRGPVG